MSKDKFKASIPRKMHWSDDVTGDALCPDCGTALEPEFQTYVVVTRRPNEDCIAAGSRSHGCRDEMMDIFLVCASLA